MAFTRVVKTSGSGTWTVPAGVAFIEVLLVGGGGGGGAYASYSGSGGGGSGGIIHEAALAVTEGEDLSWTVGGGGASHASGSDTTLAGVLFGTKTAKGGGRGGSYQGSHATGENGASTGGGGGGGSGSYPADHPAGAGGTESGSPLQAHAGGAGVPHATAPKGGGGGGAGANGVDASSTVAGAGGQGIDCSGFCGIGTDYGDPDFLGWFGGGGGGAKWGSAAGTNGAAGKGGGGAGQGATTGGAGDANTGGGGGAGTVGGAGGSGIIVIYYEPLLCTLTTDPVDEITFEGATLNGTILEKETTTVDLVGFLVDTEPIEAPASTVSPDDWTPAGSGEGEDGHQFAWAADVFSHAVTGLTLGKTYYVRAGVHNGAGWAYGEEVTFDVEYYVHTQKPEIIYPFTSVLLQGYVPDNALDITYVGYVWGTTSVPARPAVGTLPAAAGYDSDDTSDVGDYAGAAILSGTSPGLDIVAGLLLDTIYYFRCCAYVDGDWYYGEEYIFNTLNPISTLAVTDKTVNSATLNAFAEGMALDFELGYAAFVWGTTSQAKPSTATAPAAAGYDSNWVSTPGTCTAGTDDFDVYDTATTWTSADVGKAIYNLTQDKYSTIVSLVSSTHITVADEDFFTVDDEWTLGYSQSPFAHSAASLSGDTKYYFRAALRVNTGDGDKWFYGDELFFTTVADVVTNAVTDIGYEGVTANGECTASTAGKTVDRVGFLCGLEDVSPNAETITECLDFDGSGDHVQIPYDADADLNCGNYVTWEAWIKPDDITTAQNIYMHGYATAHYDGMRLYLRRAPLGSPNVGWGGDGSLYAAVPKSGGNFTTCCTRPNLYAAGEAVHIAFTRNGTYDTQKWFVNGIEVEVLLEHNYSFLDQHVDSYLGYGFNGKMWEVRLWDHARTQTEIAADMHKRLVGTEAGLKAYWPLTEFTGSTANDLSDEYPGDENDGTIVNATWALVYHPDIYVSANGTYAHPNAGDIFEHDFTGLSADIQYIVKAFARVNGVWKWGQDVWFTTITSDNVTTLPVTAISGSSVRLNGESTAATEGEDVDYFAFLWDEDSHSYPVGGTLPDAAGYDHYYISDHGVFDNTTFGKTVTEGIVEGNKYYVRAGIKINGSWEWSNEVIFRAIEVIGNPYLDIDWNTINQRKVQLHVHVSKADGGYDGWSTRNQAIDAYYHAGYTGLCFADHNISHAWPGDAPHSLLNAKGVEYSWLTDIPIHIVAWFSDNLLLSVYTAIGALERVKSESALAQLAHPVYEGMTLETNLALLDAYSIADGLVGQEIYNYQVAVQTGTMDEARWDDVLAIMAEDRNVWAFAVDDLHGGQNDAGFIKVLQTNAETTITDIKNAIRAGKFLWCWRPDQSVTIPEVFSITVSDTGITVSATPGKDIQWVDASGTVKHTGATFEFATETYEKYIRFRVAQAAPPWGTAYIGSQPFLKSYLDSLLVVQTDAATDIAAESATLNGTITLGGTEYPAFVWGTTSLSDEEVEDFAPDEIYDSYWEGSQEVPPLETDDTFSHGITDLVEDSTYYFRAAAKDYADVWIYGEELSFVAQVAFIEAAVALSGAGTLSSVGVRTRKGEVAISGVGALSPTSKLIFGGFVSLSGVGALSSLAEVVYLASVGLSGAGLLIPKGGRIRLGGLVLSGNGQLSPVARTLLQGVVALSSAGTLSADDMRIRFAVVPFGGTGQMAALAGYITNARLALSGVGSLSPSGQSILINAVSLSGGGTLTAAPGRIMPCLVALSGTGLLTAQGGRIRLDSVLFSGAGLLAATASRTILSYLTLSGIGGMAPAGEILGKVYAAVAMSGTGSLAALSERIRLGATMFSGLGTLTTAVERIRPGAAVFGGTGGLALMAYRTRTGVIVFTGSGELVMVAKGVWKGESQFLGVGTLTVLVPGLMGVRAVALLDQLINGCGLAASTTCIAGLEVTEPNACQLAVSQE